MPVTQRAYLFSGLCLLLAVVGLLMEQYFSAIVLVVGTVVFGLSARLVHGASRTKSRP